MWKFPGSGGGSMSTIMEDMWLAQQLEQEKNCPNPNVCRGLMDACAGLCTKEKPNTSKLRRKGSRGSSSRRAKR